MTLSADHIDSEYFMDPWRWTSERGRSPPRAARDRQQLPEGDASLSRRLDGPASLPGEWRLVYAVTALYLQSAGPLLMPSVHYLHRGAITKPNSSGRRARPGETCYTIHVWKWQRWHPNAGLSWLPNPTLPYTAAQCITPLPSFLCIFSAWGHVSVAWHEPFIDSAWETASHTVGAQ